MQCHGSRTSLDAARISGDLAVFAGDETSFGIAHAFARADSARTMHSLFEVTDIAASAPALARLGLEDADLSNGGPTTDFWAIWKEALAALDTAFILTGKASTIQRLLRALRQRACPLRQPLAKPIRMWFSSNSDGSECMRLD